MVEKKKEREKEYQLNFNVDLNQRLIFKEKRKQKMMNMFKSFNLINTNVT